MKITYAMWLVFIGMVAATFYIFGCSSDSGSAPKDDCYQTSDSTMVCGDTNFQLY